MKVASPRTLEEALRALRDAGKEARLLAGGTDLLVELEAGRAAPEHVVDLWSVAELRYARAEEGGVRFGALTTCADLLRSPLAPDVLAAAAREVGAMQIQNRATLGGNLGTASPAADLNPVLVALGARVRLVSLGGLRELAVDGFLVGYRATARAPDELIESIFLPARPAREERRFRKVGTRRAQSIAKLVVALAWTLDERGNVSALRGAAGSLAERTVRLAELERALQGGPLDPARVREAVRASATKDVRPRDDVRSTASYRRQVYARVVRDLLLH